MKLLQLLFLLFIFTTQPLTADTGDSYTTAEIIPVNSTTNGTLQFQWNNGRYYEYKIIPSQSGTVHIYSTGFKYNTDLNVYENQNFSTYYAYDQSYNKNVDLTFTVTANNSYNLELYNYKNYTDDFTLYVEFTPYPINAIDDSYTTQLNTTLNENVLTNDTGYGLTITSHTNPSHGTLTINSDGSFIYTPNSNYEGSDSFTYTVTDINNLTSTATVTILIVNAATTHSGFADFTKRTSFFAQGEMVSIGNTFTVHPLIYTTTTCNTYTNQAYSDPLPSNNKYYYYCHYNVDGQQDEAATRAELRIPPNSQIKWAGLYWQALTDHRTSYDDLSIKIRRDENSSAYITVTATAVNYYSNFSNNIYAVGSSSGTTSADAYSAFADITELFKSQGWLDGNYTVASSDIMEGRETSFGVYSAWNLIVIYENKNASYKSFSIFDGWKLVQNYTGYKDVQVDISGFYTPKSTPINAKVAVFAAEGDYNINGDKLEAVRQSDNKRVEFLNSNNPAYTDQTFSSFVDTDGLRTPTEQNNNGIDIQIFDVGSDTTYNLLQPEQKDMEFHFTTTGDLYFPSMIAFSTEIYTPKMCYDFSVKQDGAYLKLNRNQYPKPVINDFISPSDLEITVYLRNKEADFAAENIALKSDINNSVFFVNSSSSANPDYIYVSNVNGAKLIERGTLDYTAPLPDYSTSTDYSADNQGLTNGHDILKGIGSLGSQEYVYAKYTLHPNNFSGITDINESLGLSVSFYITVDNSKIDYTDYLLGTDDVPLCPPSDAYVPEWGQFNVVEHGQTTNNIRTQISRNPFDADVIFDSDITTGKNDAPTGDINTTVVVEIIDIDAFGDLNASCANPDSAVTAPIYLGLHFTPDNYQQLITPQNNNYYNFAVKNAAFRVWYFTDSNSTLIQNWTATTEDADKTITSISGLYNASVHTACSTECDTAPNSTNCFECIFRNYAKPLCSRDNFSVRPESYDVRIYDNNQSSVETDPKNDLSEHYGYDTSSLTTPTTRMQLAAGYDYRFDINSTGHDNTQKTPGYTRYFNGANDFNATLIWDSTLADTSFCNDTSNQNISFYVKNGEMINEERNASNVGEYKLNIIDKSWTAVDWQYLDHHDTSINGGFVSGTDCTINSTTSSTPPYGCTISTNHGSDGNGHFYRDTDILFHPYTFDLDGSISGSMPITPTVGTAFTTLGANNYIYYADINQSSDENMSYHLKGSITAMAANGNALNNFVDQCYAVALKISVKSSDRTLQDSNGNNVTYVARFHDLNTTGEVVEALDINYSNNTTPTTDITFATEQSPTKGYFPKTFNGKTDTLLNMNYARSKSITINPKELSFISYTAECLNDSADCTFSADMLHNKTTQAIKDLNTTLKIKHYYGRTHNPRQSFAKTNAAVTFTDANDLIYYEVYCDGSDCNKSLLQNGVTSQFSDDPRWFINTNHTAAFGLPGHANQKGYNVGNGYVKEIIPATGNHPDAFGIRYDGTRGYPYKTTMENNASGWLIYNKYNPAATKNSWDIEFTNASGNWAGVRETNSTTKRNATDLTNRRTLW